MKTYSALLPLIMAASCVARAGGQLEMSYASESEIPSEYVGLFTQQGSKWVLTGVNGVKSQTDVDRLQESLRKEREDHKAAKTALAAFNGLSAEEVLEKLDRIAELEAANGGKLDETKINEIVEARLKARLAPVERERDKLKQELQETSGKVVELTAKEKTRIIHDHIRKAAGSSKMRETAVEDALMLGERILDVDDQGNVTTRDNVGVTPGLSAEVWLTELQDKRPHWWPESSGAGAKGGNGGGAGTNPFSNEHWNMTEQGRIFKENPAKAEQLAKSAGTKVGGGRPAVKK
jgi:hypothetical protein